MARERSGQQGAGLQSGLSSKESAKGKGFHKMSEYQADGNSARLGAGKRSKAATGPYRFK